MTQTKNKWKITLMVFLFFTLCASGYTFAETGYEIVPLKGTVKVKKDHALMLYKDASAEITFPNGSRETFHGPFYATLTTLQKPFTKKQFSLFKEEKIWKPIQRLFDEEEEIHGPTRSGPADRGAFKYEIDKRSADKDLDDPTLPADKIKEMNTTLETVDTLFNAFPKVRRIVIKALVYRHFGLNKKALETIMAYYKRIAGKPGKEIVRGQVEDYVFTEFLPIVITIEPQNKESGPVTVFYRTFTANFKLWWAAFYYNGNELIEIEKTCDNKLHPQKTFAVRKNLEVKRGESSHCIFVVVCPEWTELETLDDINAARKELLADSIKETKVQTVKDYGKVRIKLCL
jgi:hypothetical protein